MSNQNAAILWYIEKHGAIDAMSAMRELGIMRLASRICELRKAGFKIADRWREHVNRDG